ncbi:MAG: TIR domain-containing protein [Candidatus Sedimenticola sp. 6PFRAG1]
MGRCQAKTKSGHKCKNTAKKGSSFCHRHKDNIDTSKVIAIAAGATVGNLVLPGIGGIVIGGITGKLLKESIKVKTKAFVSFDFDNDRALKDFIIGQAKLPDSPFEIVDHSLKEAAPERSWEQKADRAIARSDIVIVMVGPHTHRAQGVLKEIRMARARNKRIVQVIGYKDGNYKAVPNAGRLYSWNWSNLKKLLS